MKRLFSVVQFSLLLLFSVKSSAQTSMADSLRISSFIVQLTQTLPQLALLDTAFYGFGLPADPKIKAQLTSLLIMDGPSEVQTVRLQRGALGSSERTLRSTKPWLAEFSRRWDMTTVPARVQWLFDGTGGAIGVLTPTFMTLAKDTAYQIELFKFATAMMDAADRTPNRDHADGLLASSDALRGALHLVRADTGKALHFLLSASRVARQDMARRAADESAQVARAYGDTTTWIMALALRRLQSNGVEAGIQAQDSLLRRLYDGYVRIHGQVPDALPKALENDPQDNRVLSLDAYLDRQWAGLYDRSFSVLPWSPSSTRRKPERLAIVEYATWPGCGSCWHEDMGLQPLSRRYPTANVLTLATHAGRSPDGEGTGTLLERLWAWYPYYNPKSIANWAFGRPQAPTIPYKAFGITDRDSILFGNAFVDGQIVNEQKIVGLMEREGKKIVSEQIYYQEASRIIDRQLERAPEVTFHVSLATKQAKIRVNVQLDSIPEQLHRGALRIVMYQDTVWLHSGTPRRIYTNVVRAAAYSDSLPLGLPLPKQTTRGPTPALVSWTFDIGAVEDTLKKLTTDPTIYMRLWELDWGTARRFSKELRDTFYDPRDWKIDRSRLWVVAFVQDLDTGAVLQAVRVKVPR